MVLSIREALESTVLKHGKLLAGKEGLDNNIKWVTVVEVLEDTNRLAEGELLITTAYGLAGEPEKRTRFIENLAHRKLAGVAILTGFYLPEVSAEIIEQANRHHLPLIELPSTLNFSDITRSLLQRIVQSKFELLDYSENMHQELLQVVLSGKSFPSIAGTLAARTGANVYIYDAKWEPVAEHELEKMTARYKNKVLTSFIAGELRTATERHEIVTLETHNRQTPMLNVATPVTAEDTIYGYIVLVKERRTLSELDRISLRHAALVCALEFLKLKAIEETKWRMQGDFLEEILAGKWIKASMIMERGKLMGFDFAKLHNVMIIKLCVPLAGQTETWLKQQLFQLYEMATSVFREIDIKVFAKLRHESLVMLLEGETLTREAIAGAAGQIRARWKESDAGVNVLIGIGNNRLSIDQLTRCAEEAELALKFGHFLKLQDQVCFYADLGIFHWLIELYERKVDLRAMRDNVLGNLLDYDRKHGNQLMDTLETYLALNQNIQQTASALFIHRHTLKYRLGRIESKTGLNLKNHHHRLQLQMAIYIHKFLYTLE